MSDTGGRRPNILVILTDQQSAGAMSCAGNENLSTPAMDSLAATGVRFENAYCTQPLCTPSRVSLLTGLRPHATGVVGNFGALDTGIRDESMGIVFSTAGYSCAYGGKWHVPGTTSGDAPIELDEATAKEFGFERICGFNDNELADACLRFLHRDHDRPFLVVASFDNPHNICEWARCEPLPWGEVDEIDTSACPSLPANFAIPPYEPQLLRTVQAHHLMAYPSRDWSPDMWRHYRHAYYRLCERVDTQIGRILTGLHDLGLENDTLVVSTSDRGDGMGAHQWNQKTALYEESVKAPLVLSWVGVTPPGVTSGQLVSNGLDLLPTLCDCASVPIPHGLPGRSLREAVNGNGTGDVDRPVVAETSWNRLPPWPQMPPSSTGRMIRTERYKYVAYSWGQHREQLFDLDCDAGEMVNLAVDDRYQSVVQDHRQQLAKYCSQSREAFPVPQHARQI